MLAYTVPILFRYLSMVLQFITVVVVARTLSSREVGVYFEVFGAVNATYFLAGFGLPDGLVKRVSELRSIGELAPIRSLLQKSAVATAVLSLLTSGIAAIMFQSCSRASRDIALLAAGWWLCCAVVFFGSQVLVALGRPSLGSFFFYPATSIGLFAVSVPYLLGYTHPSIKGVLTASVIGIGICAVLVVICVSVSCRQLPKMRTKVPLVPVFRIGISISLARVLQTSLYWIPVWLVGVVSSAAVAASMGTASRINAAVAAMMAAIRFTIRPAIVRHVTRNEWDEIACASRRVASAATVTTIAAMLITLTVGPHLVNLVFGPRYNAVTLLVVVLLIGTLGESIGGPVDEILKMTGRAHLVTAALVCTAATEAALVWSAAPYGVLAIAAGQSIAIVAIYASLLWFVWCSNRVYVGASFSGLRPGQSLESEGGNREQNRRFARWRKAVPRLPKLAWLLLQAWARIPGLYVNNLVRRSSVLQPEGPIVSLTTYGQRIQTVYLTIESIAQGRVLPSRMILWLDDEQAFKRLPDSLRRLQARGLEVRLTKNYGPHTKYYPFVVSQPLPQEALVTADDDTLYPRTWLEKLSRAYESDPTVVNCYRARVIALGGSSIDTYSNWNLCRSTEPSYRHVALGVSGVIYPPELMSALKQAGSSFLATCRATDDLWLHAQALRAGFRVKQIQRRALEFPTIPSSQASALYNENGRFGTGNDRSVKITYTSGDITVLEEAVLTAR